MARLEARPFDKGLVVIVGAGGAGQDPHEVAVVAQVLQQAGHPPGQSGEGWVGVGCWGEGGENTCSGGGAGPPCRGRSLFVSELHPAKVLLILLHSDCLRNESTRPCDRKPLGPI